MTNITSKTILFSMVAVAAVLSFQLLTPNSAFACTTAAECPNNYFYGGQFCQGNNLYQTQIQYSCINSRCVSNQNQYFIESCTGTNNKCVQGLWYTGCTTGGTTNNGGNNTNNGGNNGGNTGGTTSNQCYSYSYEKCVGNDVYWFDSCNVQGSLAKKCSATQVCQSGGCYTNQVAYNNQYQIIYNTNNTTNNTTNSNTTTTSTTYIDHYTKGCQNNIVYWYDTYGNKTDTYKNCSATGQMCTDGACTGTPTQPKATTTSNTTTGTTTTTTASTITVPCASGQVLAKACIPSTTASNSNNGSCGSGQMLAQACVPSTLFDKQGSPDNSNQQVTQQNQGQNNATAAVSESGVSLLFQFLNKWYVWIIVGIILIVFFIIVFRKSSSKVEGRVQRA